MSETIALVLAAGKGKRLPGDLPKQYRDLGGAPVLRRVAAGPCTHGHRGLAHAPYRPPPPPPPLLV